MSEYPDDLVAKIAAVLGDDIEDEPGWSRVVIAKHILTALSLRRERGPWPHTRQRYVTEWEPS